MPTGTLRIENDVRYFDEINFSEGEPHKGLQRVFLPPSDTVWQDGRRYSFNTELFSGFGGQRFHAVNIQLVQKEASQRGLTRQSPSATTRLSSWSPPAKTPESAAIAATHTAGSLSFSNEGSKGTSTYYVYLYGEVTFIKYGLLSVSITLSLQPGDILALNVPPRLTGDPSRNYQVGDSVSVKILRAVWKKYVHQRS